MALRRSKKGSPRCSCRGPSMLSSTKCQRASTHQHVHPSVLWRQRRRSQMPRSPRPPRINTTTVSSSIIVGRLSSSCFLLLFDDDCLCCLVSYHDEHNDCICITEKVTRRQRYLVLCPNSCWYRFLSTTENEECYHAQELSLEEHSPELRFILDLQFS